MPATRRSAEFWPGCCDIDIPAWMAFSEAKAGLHDDHFSVKLLELDRANELLAAKPALTHVEHSKPAMRLCNRLGFRQIDTDGAYRLMESMPVGRDA